MPIVTTLGKRVGDRRANPFATMTLLPVIALKILGWLIEWLYRHWSVASASFVSGRVHRAQVRLTFGESGCCVLPLTPHPAVTNTLAQRGDYGHNLP